MTTNAGLRRYAVLVAFFAFLAIVAGALVTSIARPLASNVTVVAPAFLFWHRIIAAVAGFLLLGLSLWLDLGKVPRELKRLGTFAVLMVLADAGLGTQGAIRSLLPLSGILHALLAYLFFAAVVVICVLTSKSWNRPPEPVQDTWKPSLRALSLCVPGIVILQIILGASFRYKALGVLWHVLNAMLVLLLILCVAVFLIRQFPQHPALRPTAIALAVITSIQVLLGFTTFLLLILLPESSSAVIVTSAVHAGTGALTLAAGSVLAVQIRRHAVPAVPASGQ